MILIDENPVEDQVQVLRIELVLFQNLVEDLDGGLRGAVDADDRVFPVFGQLDLFLESGDTLLQLRLDFVVGLVDNVLVAGALEQVADALPLRDFQFLLAP